jgi:predicted nucleotide-binding protein
MSEQPIKLFISHASEDKEAFVKGLAEALRANFKFDVWYDEYSLRPGNSLLQTISKGLRSCDYAIVVISPAFISKRWTNEELAACFALETKERKIIIPIWHDVTEEDVRAYNPMLADRVALKSSQSLQTITSEIEEVTSKIDVATTDAQKAKQLANPSFKERAVQIRNQISERQIKNQLNNSMEGAQLVKKSATFIFDRFEQLIREQVQDSLGIQIQRYDTPTHSFPWPCIVASGPLNANIEVGYANKDEGIIGRNRLFMQMFNWDSDFPSVQGKRKDRGRLILVPDITANREVQWRNQETDVAVFYERSNRQRSCRTFAGIDRGK